MLISDEILEDIISTVRKYHPTDLEAQEREIQLEKDAYRRIMGFDYSKITPEEKMYLLDNLKNGLTFWSDAEETIQDDIEALIQLKAISAPDLGQNQVERWKAIAAAEQPGAYREQLIYVEATIEKHRAVSKLESHYGPIKQLLIELEDIIGNECFGGRIIEFCNWGELNSVGSQERQIIEFHSENYPYQKDAIPEEIPFEDLITGHYNIDDKQLNIVRGLYKVLMHLEANYGLRLPADRETN
ncbi:hypothetical protein ACVTNV_000589 [Vibrio alginolyticus]